MRKTSSRALAPRHLRPKGGPAALALVGLLFGGARLGRTDVAACAQWHASGQREVKAGRLKAASELFASCGSNEGCPGVIRAECVNLYGEVKKNIPTVIFTAADPRGRDVVGVRVYSTDQLLAESLDGRPIPLHPGRHHFRFLLASREVASSDVLVREGEKNRVVAVQLPAGAEAASPEAAPSAAGATRAPLPTAFWVSAGVGAAALASWGAFALLGRGQQSKLEACAPHCEPALHGEYDAMRRDYLIADISLGVAVASAGVATWLFLSNKPSMPPIGSTGPRSPMSQVGTVSVFPLFSPFGAGLGLRASGL